MKTCRYCGREIMSDASFCIYCMSELNERTELNAPEVISKRRARFVVACVSAAVCLIVLCVLYIADNSDKEYVPDQTAALQPDLSLIEPYAPDPLTSVAQKINSGYFADLDGDGGKEIIEFKADEMPVITINGKAYDTNIENENLPADFEVYLGDIDVSDAYTEIFIIQTAYGENKLDKWLYIYRFAGGELMQFEFNGNLLIKDGSGRFIRVPVLDSPRAHMPSQPVYLTGTGAIGWRDEYSYSDKDTYRFFELQDYDFIEEEPVHIS